MHAGCRYNQDMLFIMLQIQYVSTVHRHTICVRTFDRVCYRHVSGRRHIPRISDPVTHTAHDKKDTITRTPLLSHPSKMHYYTVP